MHMEGLSCGFEGGLSFVKTERVPRKPRSRPRTKRFCSASSVVHNILAVSRCVPSLRFLLSLKNSMDFAAVLRYKEKELAD